MVVYREEVNKHVPGHKFITNLVYSVKLPYTLNHLSPQLYNTQILYKTITETYNGIVLAGNHPQVKLIPVIILLSTVSQRLKISNLCFGFFHVE